ncbi:hypothetical protein [Corallococcus sp. CA053C]|uniref:hypothetical protein n=1 Tax=Corallococcus sp. CA053C TaxID=2316732 RepID=UPI0011C40984|nr:hypothetical protein [Corallococcus sp. CA053C]
MTDYLGLVLTLAATILGVISAEYDKELRKFRRISIWTWALCAFALAGTIISAITIYSGNEEKRATALRQENMKLHALGRIEAATAMLVESARQLGIEKMPVAPRTRYGFGRALLTSELDIICDVDLRDKFIIPTNDRTNADIVQTAAKMAAARLETALTRYTPHLDPETVALVEALLDGPLATPLTHLDEQVAQDTEFKGKTYKVNFRFCLNELEQRERPEWKFGVAKSVIELEDHLKRLMAPLEAKHGLSESSMGAQLKRSGWTDDAGTPITP